MPVGHTVMFVVVITKVIERLTKIVTPPSWAA